MKSYSKFMCPTFMSTIWNHMACTPSRNVACSIPDGVIGVFNWHIPSGPTLALGLSQPPNRNEYYRYFLEGKNGRCVRLRALPTYCADFLEIWELEPPGTLRACFAILNLTFLYYHSSFTSHLISCSAYTYLYLSISFTISFIGPSPYNVPNSKLLSTSY